MLGKCPTRSTVCCASAGGIPNAATENMSSALNQRVERSGWRPRRDAHPCANHFIMASPYLIFDLKAERCDIMQRGRPQFGALQKATLRRIGLLQQ